MDTRKYFCIKAFWLIQVCVFNHPRLIKRAHLSDSVHISDAWMAVISVGRVGRVIKKLHYDYLRVGSCMVTHTRNLCSAFNLSKVHTHSSEHTPWAVGSHLCCSAREAVGGSVPCSRVPQSWYWGWRERSTFTPPPTIPASPRLKLATFRLKVWLSNH